MPPLIRRVGLRVHDLLAFTMGSRRIEGNLFPLTARRALNFRQSHNAMVDWNKWVRILEEGNIVKERERKRHLCGKRRKWLKYEGRLL